jgi:microcystin-dependent protein
MTSVHRKTQSFGAHERPMTGDFKMSFVGYDHLGWMKCDGRQLSTSEFKMLFRTIGYTFGGFGEFFNLPDLSGRVPGMVGQGWFAGDASGEYTHTLTVPEMPTHNHEITDPGHTHSISDVSHNHSITDPGHSHTQTTVNDDFNNNGTYPDFTTPSYAQYDSAGTKTWTATINGTTTGITGTANSFTGITTTNSQITGVSTQNTGGSLPHNNIQPTLFIGNMFIFSGLPGYQSTPVFASPFEEGLTPPLQ